MTSTDSNRPRRGPEPASGTLLLRARTGAVTGRLTWPPTSTLGSDRASGGPGRPEVPAVLLLGPDHPGRVDRAACATRLSSRAGALVLDLPWERSAGLAEAQYALGWLADHACEVGADPQRLVVIGLSEATDAVAALACRVRDEGWPALAQHVLALPGPPTPGRARGRVQFDWTGSGSLDGVCGCTLILDPAAPSHPYAARLRAAGVPVRQHRLPVALPTAAQTDLLVTALVTALANTWTDLPDEPPKKGSTAMSNVTSADGTRIEYDQTGDGPAVILIGAGPNDRNANAELAALLADSCTVINYDRRGRGGSGDTAPHSIDREIEDLRAVAAVAGGPVNLFGTSGGAFIALPAAAAGLAATKIALWEPPYVVEGSRPPIRRDYRDRLVELAEKDRPGDMVELFLTDAVGMPAEVVAGMRQAPFWAFLEAAAKPALVYDAEIAGDQTVPTGDLAKVTCPLLVLDGGTTPWLTQAADAVASAAPQASTQTLTGQQHNVEASVLVPALAAFFAD